MAKGHKFKRASGAEVRDSFPLQRTPSKHIHQLQHASVLMHHCSMSAFSTAAMARFNFFNTAAALHVNTVAVVCATVLCEELEQFPPIFSLVCIICLSVKLH